MLVAWKWSDIPEVTGSVTRHKVEYLADDGTFNLAFLRAKLFADTNGLDEYFHEHLQGKMGWLELFPLPIGEPDVLRIRKHKLKVRGKGLFSLPINTPAGIFADAYEDAGMPEEAGVLRS